MVGVAAGCKSAAQTQHGDLDRMLGKRIEDVLPELGNAPPSVNTLQAYTWSWPDEGHSGKISEMVALYVDSTGKVVLWMQQTGEDELPRVGFVRHIADSATPPSATLPPSR